VPGESKKDREDNLMPCWKDYAKDDACEGVVVEKEIGYITPSKHCLPPLLLLFTQ
jgi:hypothetical protein